MYFILSGEVTGWAHISSNCLRTSLEGPRKITWLHCLHCSHVQGNCSWGPLLEGGRWSSLKNTVIQFRCCFLGQWIIQGKRSSLDFSSSVSHAPTTLVLAFYQVQTPESCKPFSSGTHTLYIHSSACTQTSVRTASSPIPAGPKAQCWVLPVQLLHVLYWGLELGNASSQEQHYSCEQVLSTRIWRRWICISRLSLFTFTGFSFAWLIASSNYRINTVKLFLKSPQSKPGIFKLAALNSEREVFSSWKVIHPDLSF